MSQDTQFRCFYQNAYLFPECFLHLNRSCSILLFYNSHISVMIRSGGFLQFNNKNCIGRNLHVGSHCEYGCGYDCVNVIVTSIPLLDQICEFHDMMLEVIHN